MTQKQWAAILGVSPQFVSQWKQGKVGLSAETALRWAKIMGIGVETLLTLTPRQRASILRRRLPDNGFKRRPPER